MSILLFKIALILILVSIFIQDVKFRAVHIFLMLALGIFAILYYLKMGFLLKDLILNLLFISATFIGLWIFLSIRSRELINPFKSHIGLGDLVFFIMIIPLFSLKSYVYFYIIGLIVSALLHLIISKGKVKTSIPLAGYLSVFIIVCFGIELIYRTNLFYSF